MVEREATDLAATLNASPRGDRFARSPLSCAAEKRIQMSQYVIKKLWRAPKEGPSWQGRKKSDEAARN